MHIHSSPAYSLTIFTIETQNHDTLVLVELRGRAHEVALRSIAKTRNPTNYVFKKNNEFLISSEHYDAGKKYQIADEKGQKTDLSSRVREISDEEFEEIRTTAAQHFREINTEEHASHKKEMGGENLTEEKSEKEEQGEKPVQKNRANAKKYFDEHMKKEYSDDEKRSHNEKGERIRRFEERMRERDKKIGNSKRK